MRSISSFLFVVFTIACSSKNQVKTELEFARIYLDSLKKKNPEIVFKLNADLTITSKKDTLEMIHYIDNAYAEYKLAPDSIKSVLSRFTAAATAVYEEMDGINAENIVPVIKPVEYLDYLAEISKDGKVYQVSDKYNDQLVIVYGLDSKKGINYFNEDEFKTLSIPRDSLKSIALRNLNRILPGVQIAGDSALYMITAGGTYEASVILSSTIWTKENFHVDGDFVIGIPNRDLLVITGSKNRSEIKKMKEMVADSYENGSYKISRDLFKWTGKKFEKYD